MMQPSKMGGRGGKNFHKIVWIEQNKMYFIAVKEHPPPHNVMFLVRKLQLTAAPDEQKTLVV